MAEGAPDTHDETPGIGTTISPANTPGVSMAVDFARDGAGGIVKDRRYIVRAEREKARKARKIKEKTDREARQNAVMAIAAGGASWPHIGRELGISARQAKRIYDDGMERVGKESTADFVAAMDHRHAVLLQSHWTPGLTNVDRGKFVLQIMDQWTKLRGAYPASQVDLVGDVTVRREVSIRDAMRIAAEIQADRILSGEIPMPEFIDADFVEQPALNNGHALNGHDTPE